MKSIFRKAVYICVAIFFAIFAYYAIVSMSESKRYSKYSLDYLLLTPNLIKNQPLNEIYSEDYYYSAADGNKPAIYSITFFTKEGQLDINSSIEKYLKTRGYVKSNSKLFSKEFKEVTLEYSHSLDEDINVTLSLIEHIK